MKIEELLKKIDRVSFVAGFGVCFAMIVLIELARGGVVVRVPDVITFQKYDAPRILRPPLEPSGTGVPEPPGAPLPDEPSGTGEAPLPPISTPKE